MLLKTRAEYAQYLAETFGSELAVANQGLSCTRLTVNIATGGASIRESIDAHYESSDPSTIVVTRARGQSASGRCEACSEDDEFAEWCENEDNWDTSALSDEIQDMLMSAGVTDTAVAAWGTAV